MKHQIEDIIKEYQKKADKADREYTNSYDDYKRDVEQAKRGIYTEIVKTLTMLLTCDTQK